MIYSLENIINIAILVMLFVMIVYCIILNRRLIAFRNIKEEMASIINQLNASTTHAQKAIVELKKTVFDEGEKLTAKLSEAEKMADELDMINQTGSNLADRIEKGLVSDKKEGINKKSSEEDIIDPSSEKEHKVSLSDLDHEEGNRTEADALRESLRNVR